MQTTSLWHFKKKLFQQSENLEFFSFLFVSYLISKKPTTTRQFEGKTTTSVQFILWKFIYTPQYPRWRNCALLHSFTDVSCVMYIGDLSLGRRLIIYLRTYAYNTCDMYISSNLTKFYYSSRLHIDFHRRSVCFRFTIAFN